MLPHPNCEAATECIKVMNAGIDFGEKEKRLAYIAVQDKYGFKELGPVRRPTRPRAVSAYLSMNDRERFGFIKKNPRYFTEEEEGGKYYKNLRISSVETRRNLSWLMTMKIIFDKDGRSDLASIVQKRIYEFDDSQEDTNPTAVGNQSQQEMAWTE